MSRFFLPIFILLLAAFPAFAAPPPNVVVLIIDDIRWDSLGCAGNSIVVTPNIDGLAKDGVRFTQARVTTSICMTSRATLLTGQHMARHGITKFGVPLSDEAFAKTYPGVLKANGYHTGYVGKYGVGQPPKGGYDFARTYEGTHWLNPKGADKIHVTEKNARDALEFLKARPKDKAFCLTVGFFAPHAQDNAPEQYLPQDWSAKHYAGKAIPVPAAASEAALKALPPFLSDAKNEGRVRWKKRFDTPEKFQQSMTNYYRLITEVDEAIGRILAELKAQGADENTLVVVTGDNGYFHAERGLADKWYPYEEALRVPLIVRDPRVPVGKRGTVREELVLNLDVAPTLVAAAGAKVPEGMQGRDFGPLLQREAASGWRTEFYYEHPTITSKDRIPSSQAVVSRAAKYVRYPEHDYEQLFDLKSDPGEVNDLAKDPAHAKLLDAMKSKFELLKVEAK